MNCRWLGLALLLTGCTAAGDWTKSGADAAATAGAYEDCRAVAAAAVKTDADIDQDIFATRGVDWQRSRVTRIAPRTMREHTQDRAAAIVDACMERKGFVKPR
ncbi:MAG TPA: hypothetical protein VGQ90_09585 [Stellaceae bacterium]|jgi:hypothetical protein|nr:hypothetical protein [Stellaceae bacterium]